VAALTEFGTALGLAFQIQDDLLGIWGDPAITGKPAAADLYRRKLSLPVIHALRHAPHAAALADLLQQPEPDHQDVQRMLAIIEEAGSRAATEAVAATHHARALAALDAVIGDAAALGELRALTGALLGRTA
ncbi:MAG TPA: polyprenyl synthetase family protein, partial [Roseiflexaceae bacterium]|nr:polyprenyl synthetase family protein [Roseiflexaceae bacterium]